MQYIMHTIEELHEGKHMKTGEREEVVERASYERPL
jgi:hypothetical protein